MLGPVGAASVKVSSNLQAAIDAASPGDTLNVAPGVYGKIEVSKRLNLIGSGSGSVISTSDNEACVKVLADGVKISGFVVRDGFYGISMDTVQNCVISHNTVIHCAQPGIMLKFCKNNTIEYNNASFNGLGGEGWYGIYLTNSDGNIIQGNSALGNGAYGINLFPSCNNNTIRGNLLEGNMYGLYMFRDCTGNRIESNRMTRNTNSGMDMRFNCHDNLIINNTMSGNAVAGVTFMDCGSNTLKGNEIDSNARYGVQIQGSSEGNVIANNTISDSQTGIYLDASSNHIYANRISDNVVSAEDRGQNAWHALYPQGGNLWSDYVGKDELRGPNQDLPGSDRFGDEPYKINDENSDKYPIMGGQVRQITIIDVSPSSAKVRAGDNLALRVRLESKYGIAQVFAHAAGEKGTAPGSNARLIPAGDVYQGSMSTALMDTGKYDIMLSAQDRRGYELDEKVGEVEVQPRSGWSLSSSLPESK
ncbi:MAG TPA: NosD domain-containing protein [Methanotrichaceae archaeon]|nr:NosD domain-containing protein [Methanotrichaceae archaeon]